MVSLNNTLSQYFEVCEYKRNELESILFILKEWVTNEEIYARGLGNIIDKFERGFLGLNNCFTKVIKSLISKSDDFCDFVENEILSKEHEYLSLSARQNRTVFNNGLRLGEKLIERYNKADTAAEFYYKNLVEFENASNGLNQETGEKQSRKSITRLSKVQKKLNESFESYRYSQMKYQAIFESYTKNLEQILSIFNQFDSEANEKYKIILKKVRKAIDLRNAENEESYSEMFEYQPKSNEFKLSEFHIVEPSIEKYMNKRQMGLSSTYSILDPEIKLDFEVIVEKKYKVEFEDIVSSAWNGEKPSSDDFSYFIEHISNVTGRKAFCFFLNIKRNAGEFRITPAGFIFIGQLALEVLNLCESHQDFSIIKNLILLSQTFFYILENGEKVYLQQALRGHSIWKDFKFWNTFVSDGISNELHKQKMKNYETDKKASQENYKSLLFCQLISYGTIMGEFGMSLENISKILTKFTSKFKLGESEVSQIFSTISSAISI